MVLQEFKDSLSKGSIEQGRWEEEREKEEKEGEKEGGREGEREELRGESRGIIKKGWMSQVHEYRLFPDHDRK